MSLTFEEMELASEISQWLKSIADDVDRIESRTPTLRDFFAAHAMNAMITGAATGGGAKPPDASIDDWRDMVASGAYSWADAMMNERAKPLT